MPFLAQDLCAQRFRSPGLVRLCMEILILIGVLVAGIGIGLSLSFDRKGVTPPDPRPCSCECHCAAPLAREDPATGAHYLVLCGLLAILVICGVILIGFFFLHSQSKLEVTGKGKGRKGSFGAGVPLQIKDGPDVAW